MASIKRYLKLSVSLLVRGFDVLRERAGRLLGLPAAPRCVVIYYHAVPDEHRQLFARQMDTLLTLAKPISCVPSQPLPPGQRYVCVTFDDGFFSVMRNAAPELAQRQIPWTVFVPSGRLGARPDWLRQAHPAARQDRVMTSVELRALAQDPLVTIGSHTIVHANLLEVGPEHAATELSQSRAQLEETVGQPIKVFSYPFGARNSALDGEARRVGYEKLFCSEPTEAFKTREEFLCGRFNVDPDIWPLEFRLKITGAYRWNSVLHWMKKSLLKGGSK